MHDVHDAWCIKALLEIFMGKLRISIQIRIFMNIILNMQLRRFQRRFAAYRLGLRMAITDLNFEVFGNSKSVHRFTVISGSPCYFQLLKFVNLYAAVKSPRTWQSCYTDITQISLYLTGIYRVCEIANALSGDLNLFRGSIHFFKMQIHKALDNNY